MRLVHVTHQYRPAIGGAEEYIATVSEALARRGHDVHVYTAQSTDYESWTGNLPLYEEIAGVHVHRFRAIPRRALTWAILQHSLYPYLVTPRWWYQPFILIGNGPLCPGMFIDLVARGRGYDLIHLNTLIYAHAAYGYAAARLAGRPVVVTPHVHEEQRETWSVGYMRSVLDHADLILADTEYERQFHIRRGKDPEKVVTGGVGLRLEEYRFEDQAASRRRLNIPPAAQVILCLGRQIEYKGMDRVIAAGAALLPSHPELMVLIVGPESEWSQGVMSKYTGASWLRNLGSVGPEDKLAALSAADIMAMPSHGEAFGVTYLESWLAGRPVIGLAKGAVQYLISDGVDGFLVRPDDQTSLTCAIERMLDDPEAAAAMGQRGREKVLAQYTLDKITDIIEDAYRRVLAQKEDSHAH